MSKGDNSPGISRLAGVMQSMVSKGTDSAPAIELGVIQANGSLLTDNFPIPISAGEYQVCRHLSSRKISTDASSVGDHGSHSHKVETREKLKAGDRVLVVWAQSDPIVVDVIITGGEAL